MARGIGRALAKTAAGRERPLVVVNKSTVPMGSGDYVSMLIGEGAGGGVVEGVDFQVVSNPEFLREGSAVRDSLFPDRIVVGADARRAFDGCGRSTSPSSSRPSRLGLTPARRPPCPS